MVFGQGMKNCVISFNCSSPTPGLSVQLGRASKKLDFSGDPYQYICISNDFFALFFPLSGLKGWGGQSLGEMPLKSEALPYAICTYMACSCTLYIQKYIWLSSYSTYCMYSMTVISVLNFMLINLCS